MSTVEFATRWASQHGSVPCVSPEEADQLRPLPSHVPSELRHIPRLYLAPTMMYPPCVYFLVRRHIVIYVGQTNSLSSRLVAHVGTGRNFDSVFYTPVPDASRDMVESAFIYLLAPKEGWSAPCPLSKFTVESAMRTIEENCGVVV